METAELEQAMDERLLIELNDWTIYTKESYLIWESPGQVSFIVNDFHKIKFDWEENCFRIENNYIFSINIRNQLRPRCVAVECSPLGGLHNQELYIGGEEIGKYDNLVICNNLILAQYRNTRPEGKIVACIEYNGFYTPEATCWKDTDNSFDIVKFECGGHFSKIWKVR